MLHQWLGSVSPIANHLAPECGGHGLQRLVVIGIALCDLDGHDLALVVDGQMELEAKAPAHRGGAPLGQPLEHPVPPDPCVMTDRQLGAIDKVGPVFWPR